jgi:hypothetical protein
MKIEPDNILEILKDIAQNEHENFRLFKERIEEYCTKENAVLKLFRLLKGIECELKSCLDGTVHVNVDKKIIRKVHDAVKTEIYIIKCKIKHPDFFNLQSSNLPLPAGKWTGDKIDLIELIYAIQMSVDNGNVSMKSLQKAVEYIFQVKLGNIYGRLTEIDERKGDKARYLESLITNLNHILEGLK